MMIHLPIADVSVNLLSLLGLGGLVGLLSGIFGVGGGFLLTPFLIFLGVPPAVAVASGANQVIGASVSGALAHWRRGNVDLRMGLALLAGGLVGSVLGVALFAWLKRLGQLDLAISLCYVVLLGAIGSLMLVESVLALIPGRRKVVARKRHVHRWHNLPFKMRFYRSKLYISLLLPLAVGGFGGLMSALMGVGGGFLLVPLMIYILEMPTAVVVGTSLFQIVFVTANVTFLQAVSTQTVDAVLTLLLLVGGVIGAQMGVGIGAKLKGEQLRALLALIVLGVCLKLAYGLMMPPDDVFMLVE